MKLVFLDFDGVCTSMAETPGSYLSHSAEDYGPSASCVRRLVNLCNRTGAKVVISSNWRKFDDDGKWSFNGAIVRNPLPKLKSLLGKHCVGSLPPTRHKLKSEVLLSWLKKYSEEDEPFVVLDDDLSEGFQHVEEFKISQRFIKMDPAVGLTDDDCEKAYNILMRG